MTATAPSVTIRPLERNDINAVANLAVISAGRDLLRQTEMLNGVLDRGPEGGLVLVAVVDGRIVGSGRIAFFERPPESPANAVPNGWYLMGLDVLPDFRRRGIGTQLTHARMDWIFEKASQAWFFTEETNEASVELHRALGFMPVTRDFWFPTTTFHLGGGILFVATRAPAN